MYRLCKRYVDDYNGENNCDMHTNGELHVLRRYLPRVTGVTVFDIGANRGEWCEAVLRVNPHAEVHCFEPSSFTFEKLVSKNFPDNVICNNFGLGAQSSVAQLFVFVDGAGQNSLYPRFDKEPRYHEEVHLETLTDYVHAHDIDSVEYMKIDVEGNELSVLEGASSLLSEQRIRIVQFEYGEAYASAGVFLKDVLQFVGDFNYDIYKILPRSLLPIKRYDTALENFQNSNYLLISREAENQ